ncbi:unnamed protein product [Paramecium octaurelia]|uniref:Uncharacterized protein n=1 Tax=Paramecium octaurelia TaxID=43137 RepID=A0A8S1T7M5_PAROT|nr:unnamed protein product [Paramecium octaurelia]
MSLMLILTQRVDRKVVLILIHVEGFNILGLLMAILKLAEQFQTQRLILIYQMHNFQDQQKSDSEQIISSQGLICFDSEPEYLHTISIVRQHNKRNIWMTIIYKQGGLISLKFSIIKCQYECYACIENYPSICLQWNCTNIHLIRSRSHLLKDGIFRQVLLQQIVNVGFVKL